MLILPVGLQRTAKENNPSNQLERDLKKKKLTKCKSIKIRIVTNKELIRPPFSLFRDTPLGIDLIAII